MKQYLRIARKALEGTRRKNRTAFDTTGYFHDMCQYDLRDGFPIVTTKLVDYKKPIAEMLGFLRGYDSAAQFREIGCNVWGANANENEQWLSNPNRKGHDDLGSIYGVQARRWPVTDDFSIDQLADVVDKIHNRHDNRRLIVSHWNPVDMGRMALPPCHVMYKFAIDGNVLHMSMFQRSCDVPLGVPFNITGYAWLLSVVAHITGMQAGVFTHFMDDIHVYTNQYHKLCEQVTRSTYKLPTLKINPKIESLLDLETWVRPEDFSLVGYKHHEVIWYPFAV